MIEKINSFFLGRALAVDYNDFFGFSLVDSTGNAQETAVTLIGKVIYWVLAIVAIIAFFYLIASGIKYITSGGDAAKATEARNAIVNAIIGIIIVLLAFVVVRFAFSLGQGLTG